MQNYGQKFIPIGIDFDSSELYIKTDKAFFMKGLSMDWVDNGQNEFELKPIESNYLYCSIELPDGENTCIGSYMYVEGKECYIVVHNSNGFHLIYRIKGETDNCEVVYRFCQNFNGITKNPRDYFSEGRIAIKAICKYLPDGNKQLYKELYLVNKKVKNIRIVVEDSIATNSFTTPFFDTNNPCFSNPCRIIGVGVEEPNDKIKITPIPITEPNKKQNRMLNKMFKFRFKYVSVWGQASEHGVISDSYFANLSGCSNDNSFIPSCVWISQRLPPPEIAQIILEISSCEYNSNAIGNDADIYSDWKEYATYDLYNQENQSLKWYERQYDTNNENFEIYTNVNVAPNRKEIRIKFCNNKECILIPKTDIRDENPAPIKSGSVALLGKGLSFCDNEDGFNKIPQEDLEKIKIELVEDENYCTTKYSMIKVYAVITAISHSPTKPQGIYQTGSDQSYAYGFGGYFGAYKSYPGQIGNVGGVKYQPNSVNPEKGASEEGGCGQTFPSGIKGLRASLNASYFAESKQYFHSGTDGLVSKEFNNPTEYSEFMYNTAAHNAILVQEFDFGSLPCGKYVFRIHGHNDTENLIKTSTFFISTTPYANFKQNFVVNWDNRKEIIIDTSNGTDWIGTEKDIVAVIADLSTGRPYSGDGGTHRYIKGYIYENAENRIPIERTEFRLNNNDTVQQFNRFTDHNGFYFVKLPIETDIFLQYVHKHIRLVGVNNSQYNQILGQTVDVTAIGVKTNPDIYAPQGYADYKCNRFFIKGKVKQCNSMSGISGIPITFFGQGGLSEGTVYNSNNVIGVQTVFTNGAGEFKIVIHFPNDLNPSGTGTHNGGIIFGNNPLCNIFMCYDCKNFTSEQSILYPKPYLPCVGTSLIEIAPISARLLSNNKGLEHGGRYSIGLTGRDGVRRSYIQTTDEWFVDIPSETEKQSSSFSRIKITLPQSFSQSVCEQYKYLIFSLSKNLNNTDYLSWTADKIDFIDNAGNINTVNPTKVRVWYRSLAEYNKLRGFNTNSSWSFIDANGNTNVGDIVEFIQQADGTYLLNSIEGIVQYDKEGSYFLVDYTSDMLQLKDGIKFKIKRPFACEVKTLYYEYHLPIFLCGSSCTPRDNNGSQVTSFILDMFDSYFFNRQIPVVSDVKQIVPASDGQTQEKITTVINAKNYPYQYEHHSPSDTWGYKCSNAGRINAKNKYEGKRCNRNQILITGALNSANDGAINYLHYFSLEDENVIDEQGWGGIVAMLTRDDGVIALICEQAVFSMAYNDDRAVITNDGYVKLPINNRFSRPERNPSFSYGCQPKDINTIRRLGSIIMFLDSQRCALILHDFSQAVNVYDGIKSWLTNSIKEVQKSETFFWHGMFDLRRKKYVLTKFNQNNPEYTNQLQVNKYDANETISYDYINKTFEQLHYTPEYYAQLLGDNNDSRFLSFKNGKPYGHYKIGEKGNYLNYFGIQCYPMIGVVTNLENTKLKTFLFTEVYCSEQRFIAVNIETQIGQKSSILYGCWRKAEGFYTAAYLRDIVNLDQCDDVENAIFDGDPLYGRWLKALYIIDNYTGAFFRLTAITSFFNTREKSSLKNG